MSEVPQHIEKHYEVGNLLNAILDALTAAGKDITHLVPSDLAPVDAFHTRGRQATIELAALTELQPDTHVLDIGCGLGGSARYLASEYGCHVTGLDLTREYVDVATALAQRVGLSDTVTFRHGSALDLPFNDQSFEVIWTEHVQMNIEDKARLYEEVARVLKPNGTFAFHDVLQGPGGEPHYPVPWAEHALISFLASPDAIRQLLHQSALQIVHWVNATSHAIAWFDEAIERIRTSESTPLGLHLLMGKTSHLKFTNQLQNLKENRVLTIQAVAHKHP